MGTAHPVNHSFNMRMFRDTQQEQVFAVLLGTVQGLHEFGHRTLLKCIAKSTKQAHLCHGAMASQLLKIFYSLSPVPSSHHPKPQILQLYMDSTTPQQ